MQAAAVEISGFTSVQARETFRRRYAASFAKLWPVPFLAEDIGTRYGTVRTYRSGPRGVRPIVLLGGRCGFAASWYKNAAALSLGREVIALDPLGELGLSVQHAPIRTADDAACWLDEVLAATDACRGHLVGATDAAWLILNHQAQALQPASALTLVEPLGIAASAVRFRAWLTVGNLAAWMPGALRSRTAGRLGNVALADRQLARLARFAVSFRRRLPAPSVPTQRQLASLAVPTTVLLGEHRVPYDRGAALATLAAAPAVRTEVVAGAGNAVLLERPDVISAAVLFR